MSTALYDIANIIKQDEPCLVKALPHHVFVCSSDVLPDYCHTLLWIGCTQTFWKQCTDWFVTLCSQCTFCKAELLSKMRLELLGMQGPDFDPTVKDVPSDYHCKLLVKTNVVWKALKPKHSEWKKIGLTYAERCGPNQLEVIAQAVAPRHCTLCERPFVMDGSVRNICDVELWKKSGNCKCEALFCKECLFEHITKNNTKIGPQHIVKCPGCTKPVVCTPHVKFLAHVAEVYEAHLAEQAAEAAREASEFINVPK